MVKRYQIALYLDKSAEQDGSDYVRIKKSTQITLSVNPQSETYGFISDEFDDTELLAYNPSIDQDLTMMEDEPDYQMLFDKFFALDTGKKARINCLIVFKAHPIAEEENTFKAWQSNSTLIFNDMNGVDSKLNFNVALGGAIQRGKAKFTLEKPEFIEGMGK